MEKTKLFKNSAEYIRVLGEENGRYLVIDCIKETMPNFIDSIADFKECSLEELCKIKGLELNLENISARGIQIAKKRFLMITEILPYIENKKKLSSLIPIVAKENDVSVQTVRNYLCRYLAFQNVYSLAPKEKCEENYGTKYDKDFRWALNKFYYTRHQNSLNTAYEYLIKARFCDDDGKVKKEHPSIHQFRYYYRTHKNIQRSIISREGIKEYQKNYRPLLGDGVQDYAKTVGYGMLDGTICDIYLIGEDGALIGRPILTVCVDAYSSMCLGYYLSWVGGTYSVKELFKNIITDKVEWCRKFGIAIKKEEWDIQEMPRILITDKGTEYTSFNSEQIVELGIKVVELPSYRPDLKATVERLFGLIQDSYKKVLKGKGVIESDYRQRGAHDYRKDAVLTLREFEQIILRCIIYYNTKRIIENYPLTKEMIEENVKPYANEIFNYGKKEYKEGLLDVDEKSLYLTLLPRTKGVFSRNGLKVNGLRYKNENYTENYLKGGTVTIAYDPNNLSSVWLLENFEYIEFKLIESRFEGCNLETAKEQKAIQKEIVKSCEEESLQARVDLISHIESIANVKNSGKTKIEGVRKARYKARIETITKENM